MASSGFTLLRMSEESTISQEFIFAFLKTEVGNKQLVRRNRNSMYPAVTEIDVFDVYIPKPDKDLEDKVIALIRKSLKCHDEFYDLVSKQEEMLNSFLKSFGVPPSPLEGNADEVDCNTVTSSKFFSTDGSLRFDADFFRNEYIEFEENIKKTGNYFTLGDYFNTLSGRSLGADKGLVPYVKQGVLTNAGINWSAVSYEPGNSSLETGRVKKEDILLASTAHEIYYVGRKVDYVRDVPKEIEATNFCVADIIIIRPKDNKPKSLPGSYVAAFLRNPSGLHQVQRCIRGLRGGHVYGKDLAQNVYIPLPDDKWLSKFEDISAKFEKKRQDAKEYFHEAVALVKDWLKELDEKEPTVPDTK